MKNFVQKGDTLDLTAPYAVSSGDGFQINDIFAVAVATAGNGAAVEGLTEGVFDLKYGVNATIAVGAKVYWDNTNKNVTGTASTNLLIGHCVKAAAANDATARVKIIPAA